MMSMFLSMSFGSMSRVGVLNFVSSGQSVMNWIVKKRVLPIAPWERLVSNSHVFVRDEGVPRFVVFLLFFAVTINPEEEHGGNRDEESHFEPKLLASGCM